MRRFWFSLALVALASPVYAQAVTRLASQSVTGTITANATSVVLPVPAGVGFGSIGVEALGTFTGTIQVECAASTGGGTFVALSLAPRNSTTTVTSFTAAGQWAGSVAGCQRIQATSTAWTSGTAVITLVGNFSAYLPASAVNGGGTLSTTCLTWPLGTPLCEEAANHLFQKNTTNAQRASWANTYASTISYEAFSIDWQTLANVALVGTRTAATGTTRAMRLWSQSASGAVTGGVVQVQSGAVPVIRLGFFDTVTSASLASGTTGATGNLVEIGQSINNATSGAVVNTAIVPTYNQTSGSAANTDLLIKRTPTALGSGRQLFLDSQLAASTSMFSVTAGGTGLGTQIAVAQQTVPTCTSNCGTSPSIVGSDTAMTVTMGGTGSPASGFVITFNGTWLAAPSCTGVMAKTGMAVGKLPMVIVTTTTTLTVTTNGVAPATSDVYHFHCLGIQ